MEAADASVTVDSEVVAKRVSHPNSDQLGQPRSFVEQRRYQEESSWGTATTVNANGGQGKTAVEERQLWVKIFKVHFSYQWQFWQKKSAKEIQTTFHIDFDEL